MKSYPLTHFFLPLNNGQSACKGLPFDEFVTADNIHQFENCTTINGSLIFQYSSFTG